MANLNPGVTITPGAAAGTGGTAALPAVSADGLRGLATVTTGAAGLIAGALAVVHLATPLIADMDAYVQSALQALYPGATNAGAWAGVEVLVTPVAPPAPPAGVVFFPVLTHSGGTATGFGIGSSGVLLPSTTYRFSWRVLT